MVSIGGLFASTIAYHNGVNIIRDGISGRLPYLAELIHAYDFEAVMASQTKLSGFSDADWTRTVFVVPDRFFATIDQVKVLQGGTFNLTGRWTLLGDPEMSEDTLTVRQWPRGEPSTADSTTYFHMQAPGHLVSNDTLEYLRHGLSFRYYPYAEPRPNLMAQSRTATLASGETEFLYALGHESGARPEADYALHPVAPGIMRVVGDEYAAYLGAGAGAATVSVVSVDSDLFYLDGELLSVAGGRSATIAGHIIFETDQPMTGSFLLPTGHRFHAETGPARGIGLTAEQLAELRGQLTSDRFDRTEPRDEAMETIGTLETLWEFDAGGQVSYVRPHLGNPGAHLRNEAKLPLPPEMGVAAIPSQAGHVSFVDEHGREVKRLDVGAPVNDIAFDDLDRNGQFELLIARQDSLLQCLNSDGSERFSYTHEQQRIVNTALFIPRVPMVYVFVADRSEDMDKAVCVASGDQRLVGLSPQGERQWMFWWYAGVWNRHGMYDLDGDGIREIVGGNGTMSDADKIYFLDGQDNFRKRLFRDGWGASLSSLLIGDITGDGRDELIVGTSRNNVWVADPTLEQDDDFVLWAQQLGHNVIGLELVITAEGSPLLIAGSEAGFIVAFDGVGRKQWATAVGAPVLHMATVGPSTDAAIVAALADGSMVAASLDGTVTHRIDLPSRATTLAVAGPAHSLILVACEDHMVRGLRIP